MAPSDFSHGVEYTPATVSSSPTISIDDERISYIRLQWVDLANIVRYRVIPVSYFRKLIEGPRPSVTIAKCVLGLIYLRTAPGFGPVGEYIYAIDISTLRLCPYAPGHASVLGWFQEKTPIKTLNGNLSVEVDLCPRSLLRRIVEDAKMISDAEFLVGFETEFILLKSTRPMVASSYHQWSASNAMATGSIEAKVMHEISEALITSGIELQMYHAEAAPGQYEVVTGPLPPLQAADALIHTRETVTNIAAKHGLRATFAPRVFMDSTGSAAHAHISVHSSRSLKQAEALSTYETSFLAGLLDNLSALPAITLPIPASYKRVMDGVWSGGTYICWGTENREALIRLTNATSPASRRFELRFLDGTANPYVALAGILGSGHIGIQKKRELTIKDCCGQESAAQMSEQTRQAHGITERLPLCWEDARRNLEKSQTLRGLLGQNFVEKYLSVNKTLSDALQIEQESEADGISRLVEFF